MKRLVLDNINNQGDNQCPRNHRRIDLYESWAQPQIEVASLLYSFCERDTLKDTVLDAGCGTGLLTKQLLNGAAKLDVTGLDLSEEALRAYEKINGKSVAGNLEQMPFEDDDFYHCLSSFALHWTNLSKSLPELIRVTKAYLSIALPVKGSLNAFDFPFPQEEEVLSILQSAGLKKLRFDIQKHAIPYQGVDFVRYFHYTGTDFQRGNEMGLKGKNAFERWKNLYRDEEFFRVLYVHGERG